MSSQKNNFSVSKFEMSLISKSSGAHCGFCHCSPYPVPQTHSTNIIFTTPFSHHLQSLTDFSATAINTNLSSLQVFQNRNNSLTVRSPLKWGILRRIKLSSPCCSVERPSYSRNITFYTEGSLTFQSSAHSLIFPYS